MFILNLQYTYGHKQTNRQTDFTHTSLQCSPASVGLAQAVPARSVYAKTAACASYYYYNLRGWEVKTSNLNFYSWNKTIRSYVVCCSQNGFVSVHHKLATEPTTSDMASILCYKGCIIDNVLTLVQWLILFFQIVHAKVFCKESCITYSRHFRPFAHIRLFSPIAKSQMLSVQSPPNLW